MTHREAAIAKDRLRRALIAFQTALWAEQDQQVPVKIRAAAADLVATIAAAPQAELSGIDPTLIAKAQKYLADPQIGPESEAELIQ